MIFLGLGTNLGDRSKNLDDAGELLSEKITIIKKSSIFERLCLRTHLMTGPKKIFII